MKQNIFTILLLLTSCTCFAQKNNTSKVNDVLKNESAATIQAGYDAL